MTGEPRGMWGKGRGLGGGGRRRLGPECAGAAWGPGGGRGRPAARCGCCRFIIVSVRALGSFSGEEVGGPLVWEPVGVLCPDPLYT